MMFAAIANGPEHFHPMQLAARSVRFAFCRDLTPPTTPARKAAPVAPRRRSETYEILTPAHPIRNRKLTRVGAKQRSGKEAIMLDVAFVALGLAVLALMGVYALVLRKL